MTSQCQRHTHLVKATRQSLLHMLSSASCSSVHSAPQHLCPGSLTCYSTSNAAKTGERQEQRGKDWRGKLHNQSCMIWPCIQPKYPHGQPTWFPDDSPTLFKQSANRRHCLAYTSSLEPCRKQTDECKNSHGHQYGHKHWLMTCLACKKANITPPSMPERSRMKN